MNLEVEVECTLKEYLGCLKTIKFFKREVQLDNRTIDEVEIEKHIEIRPGYGKESVIFSGEGHQDVGIQNGDLIINFKTINVENYVRKGDDLIYTHSISLNDALNCVTSFEIQSLEGRTLLISVD